MNKGEIFEKFIREQENRAITASDFVEFAVQQGIINDTLEDRETFLRSYDVQNFLEQLEKITDEEIDKLSGGDTTESKG